MKRIKLQGGSQDFLESMLMLSVISAESVYGEITPLFAIGDMSVVIDARTAEGEHVFKVFRGFLSRFSGKFTVESVGG